MGSPKQRQWKRVECEQQLLKSSRVCSSLTRTYGAMDDVPACVMFLQHESRRYRPAIIHTVGLLAALVSRLQPEERWRAQLLASELIDLALHFSAQPADHANDDDNDDADIDSDDSDSDSDSNDDDTATYDHDVAMGGG